MGESRAGVRIAARRAHVGLGATGGPPTVRVFFGLAHLHAAAAHFGFRAVAIATARGDAAQQGRRVGKKRERAGEQTNRSGEQSDGDPAAQNCSIAKSSHAAFSASSLKKTDSAERLRVPLPGFWNLVRRWSVPASGVGRVVWEFRSRFRFEFASDFGAGPAGAPCD